MSFFKRLGTKASKFQFNIWIDTVIGVYPSSYCTNEHSTEGICVMLKRRNKSYRTKIALPETGGHVHVNDCIKFTSTLYQKKKKNDDVHILLPKPFILRVCNNSHHKIRWETNIDLSDYASIFGVDSQESFTLQFCYKSKQDINIESLHNIPLEITVRLRIKSIWLKTIDNISQASTDSVSRISSSMQSELSDVENYKLFDTLSNKQPTTNVANQIETAFNNNHQHKYHNVLFSALPEEHSIHNSSPTSPVKVKRSALDSFLNFPPPPPPLPNSELSASELTFQGETTHVRNLSLITSPNEHLTNSENNLLLSSPTNTLISVSMFDYDVNNSGFLLEDELIRIDEKMNKLAIHENERIAFKSEVSKLTEVCINDMDIPHLIDVMCNVCINDMDQLNIEDRFWSNLIPLHCAIIFRCFIHWNVFEENVDNTQLILHGYISRVTTVIHSHIKNDLEQSYWLLRLTTIIYWLHLYYPHILCTLQKPPELTRHDTFEPIQSPILDDGEIHEVTHDEISNDNCVVLGIKSGNHTVDSTNDYTTSIPIERTLDYDDKKSSDSIETPINLQYWFVEKLTKLCHFCFDNIIDNTLHKLSRIPYQHVFDENECGEQGSNTMDMIFAVMNSVWFIWHDMKLFNVYRIQICQQILQYTIVRLINNLLIHPEYCTIAGGFRLKVIKSMISDWSQSNSIQKNIFADIMSLLDEMSALLLTCAVVKRGEELLQTCPSISAATINQILNNYNSEATNEPLSAEILTPILEIAASTLPDNKTRVSVQDICFCKQSMKTFNVNNYPLQKIALCDITIPYQISQYSEFKFLMNINDTDNVIL